MNHTIKDATVKVLLFETLNHLSARAFTFVAAYNFAKDLEALRWRMPFQMNCDT